MNPEYIIVQAGGRGSRMEYLTDNKPKALVPVEKKPMIFHLFDKYPDKKFIIIGDYKIDVLRCYLETFAKVEFIIVDGKGKKGTIAGIKEAMKYIPDNHAFMLIWSDLVLPRHFEFPISDDNYVGLSKGFECRWKYENEQFCEEKSVEYGVAGLFLFKNKSIIQNVPDEGEFVKWLGTQKITFNTFGLYSTQEFGLISRWEEKAKDTLSSKCRPFNQITECGDHLIKEGIDEQGKKLAVRERLWYKTVTDLGFSHIPYIYNYDPIRMSRIKGRNIYEYAQITDREKKEVIKKCVDILKELHSMSTVETDYFSIIKNFYKKTFERIDRIRSLVPFSNERIITINGRNCRNVYFFKKQLWERISKYDCKKFCIIHGDCTFSNMMLDENEDPILIDPRGYFGNTELFGDPAYDWAKIYYSIIGNYDRFNLKNFKLSFHEKEVEVKVESNQWESLEQYYLSLIADDVSEPDIKLIHSLIWLSLTTYAWEDYDSICAAFYLGLYYLEEAL